jgi:predicted O-methyltransferase YrrM
MEIVNPAIEQYICGHIEPESELLQQLSRDTYANVLMPRMLSGHLQGRVLSFISKLHRPSTILEIGTFTGYSAICLAEGLAPKGKLYTVDINEELEQMAQGYFKKAQISDRVQQLIGDAMQIIPTIDDTFDLVFIDADKRNYSNYYDLVFDKVSKGGLIIADNILWSGKVTQPNPKDKDLSHLLSYNQKLKADSRVIPLILPLRDGLSIAKKIV